MISDKELLDDISVKRKEARAYNHLAKGYEILANIPENWQRRSDFLYQSNSNKKLETECRDFLKKLLTLAKERKLDASQ